MSEEDFLGRWSRLKRKSDREKKSGAEPSPARGQPGHDGTIPQGGPTPEKDNNEHGGPSEPAFDPASLPPIESITAASDIRAFLQSGVPADLAKAALRRAWATDPAIRDFIGIAENQWDFTDPTAIPGFGPLEATDDLGQLVSQAMGKLGEMSKPDPAVAASTDAASPAGGEPASSRVQTPHPSGWHTRNKRHRPAFGRASKRAGQRHFYCDAAWRGPSRNRHTRQSPNTRRCAPRVIRAHSLELCSAIDSARKCTNSHSFGLLTLGAPRHYDFKPF